MTSQKDLIREERFPTSAEYRLKRHQKHVEEARIERKAEERHLRKLRRRIEAAMSKQRLGEFVLST